MGITEFLTSMTHTLKMARKPGSREFTLYLKLVLLSTAALGLVGFVIQFVGSLFSLGR